MWLTDRHMLDFEWQEVLIFVELHEDPLSGIKLFVLNLDMAHSLEKKRDALYASYPGL